MSSGTLAVLSARSWRFIVINYFVPRKPRQLCFLNARYFADIPSRPPKKKEGKKLPGGNLWLSVFDAVNVGTAPVPRQGHSRTNISFPNDVSGTRAAGMPEDWYSVVFTFL